MTKARKRDDPPLMAIAATHERTAAHVLPRWVLEHEFVVLPKSVNPERINENFDVSDF